MPARFPSGGRVFAPSGLLTALLLVLIVSFVSLGRWQWHRGDLRQAQWQEFARGADHIQPLGSRSLEAMPRFQRISTRGRFDSQHQFLLDNRLHEGRAGYEVLTPLLLPDGRAVLVDRGWIAFSGYRDRLPDVAVDGSAEREVIGRVDELPTAGLAQGRAAPSDAAAWPKLTSYPDATQLRVALKRAIEPRVVLLDPRAADGYVRDWRPPGLAPLRHWSYAIQWWTFAAAALVLWWVLSRRRGPTPE